MGADVPLSTSGLDPPALVNPLAADIRRQEAQAERIVEAELLVDAFNDALAHDGRPLWSPTIEAAFLARRPWLRVYCAGCQQEAEIDLRRIVRPKDFPVLGLHAAMGYESMCRGGGPEPQIIGLAAFPFDRRRVTRDDIQG